MLVSLGVPYGFRSCVSSHQVGNPGFAIVDEAYPYISKRLLTDDSPRLREALRYMIYGKSNVFDVARLIDLLQVQRITVHYGTVR